MPLSYEINASLRLKGGGGGFQRSMTRMSSRVRAFADRLRGARGAAGGLVRSLLSIGAGYLGFRVIVGGIRRVVGGMSQFQQQIEQTQIGLQSIISTIDGISFEGAAASAQAVYSALREDALTSTATTQEMFSIFQGIVGPIRAAGASLQTVRDITGSTVAAATALGVDFAQAERDIGLMVRGTAGMDTRLFSLLRSMNLINQTTEEWNRNLTTSQRIEELQRALGSFDQAAAAYGQSFAGVTSTFRDIVGQLGGSLAGPVFAKVTEFLGRINALLLENRDGITRVLSAAGESAARAFEYVANVAFGALNFIAENWAMISQGMQSLADRVMDQWDAISRRMASLGDRLQGQQALLSRLIAAIAALSTLRTVLAPVLTVVSALMSVFEGAGGAAGAAGAGGAAAAEGTGGAAAAASLGPLAVVLAVLASVGMVAVELWESIAGAMFFAQPILEGIWNDLVSLGSSLWDMLRPLMRLVGGQWLVILAIAFTAVVIALRVIIFVVARVAELFAWFARQFEEYIVNPIIEGVGAIIGFIGSVFERLGRDFGEQYERQTDQERGGRAAGRAAMAELEREYGGARGGIGSRYDPSMMRTPRTRADILGAEGTAPGGRPQSVTNFHRGSVTVRQEFRQADPDRVMVRMINDIDAQAERRVQSGFAPAFSR